MKPFYTCPQCHKNVRDLKAHTARMHPEGGETQGPETQEPENQEAETQEPENQEPENNENENLEIKAPPGGGERTYHCTGCGGSLTKGQNPCPKCGEQLAWEAVE